jgi:hypothetical protein
LQMGHQQTLLRQVDGLMARCLGQAAAVAVTPAVVAGQAVAAAAAASEGAAEGALQAVQWSLGQLAALGVAAAWRLGAWDQLRGYLSVLEAAGNSPDGVLRPLSAADRWEVSVALVWGLVVCGNCASSRMCAIFRASSSAHVCITPVADSDSHTCLLLCTVLGSAAVLHGCYPGGCTAWLPQGGHEWAAQCARRRPVAAASHCR